MAARNLVICCDGTNNTLTGGLEDTNVLKLYGYLRKHANPDTTGLYYDPGVGAPDAAPPTGVLDLLKRRWSRIAGLASGQGVYENIGQGYGFLMREWHDGDRIFCFGFSRGAFTARAIVGMVNLFGVLRPEHEPMIPTLVRIYFSQPDPDDQAQGRKNVRRHLARWMHKGLARPRKAGADPVHGPEEASGVGRRLLAEQVRRNFARPADVYWVGVWDTVESVGLPPFGSRDNPSTATFCDKPRIRHVRHALALDEHRWPFLPRRYDAPSVVDTDDGRTLRQLWFPGVHCDVGGSYAARDPGSLAYPEGRTGLADAALVWMVNEVAHELGVPPLSSLLPVYDDFGMPCHEPFAGALPLRHDPLHDTPYWALAGMTVRQMQTERMLTNKEARERKAGVLVDARSAAASQEDGPSVWDERRSPWWLLTAAVTALVALTLSGWNLGTAGSLLEGPAAASDFAQLQLMSILPEGGLHADHSRSPLRGADVAWAMAWDFVLIAAVGYLIARAASRVFTWAAGPRSPGQGRPWWLLAMGWLPALAVGADAMEDLLTLGAFILDGIALPSLAGLVLYGVGACSLAKLAGYVLCVLVFGSGRLLLALWPTDAVGKVGRRVSASRPRTAAADNLASIHRRAS
jgi:uncharacterized protein (DUF2235 family)